MDIYSPKRVNELAKPLANRLISERIRNTIEVPYALDEQQAEVLNEYVAPNLVASNFKNKFNTHPISASLLWIANRELDGLRNENTMEIGADPRRNNLGLAHSCYLMGDLRDNKRHEEHALGLMQRQRITDFQADFVNKWNTQDNTCNNAVCFSGIQGCTVEKTQIIACHSTYDINIDDLCSNAARLSTRKISMYMYLPIQLIYPYYENPKDEYVVKFIADLQEVDPRKIPVDKQGVAVFDDNMFINFGFKYDASHTYTHHAKTWQEYAIRQTVETSTGCYVFEKNARHGPQYQITAVLSTGKGILRSYALVAPKKLVRVPDVARIVQTGVRDERYDMFVDSTHLNSVLTFAIGAPQENFNKQTVMTMLRSKMVRITVGIVKTEKPLDISPAVFNELAERIILIAQIQRSIISAEISASVKIFQKWFADISDKEYFITNKQNVNIKAKWKKFVNFIKYIPASLYNGMVRTFAHNPLFDNIECESFIDKWTWKKKDVIEVRKFLLRVNMLLNCNVYEFKMPLIYDRYAKEPLVKILRNNSNPISRKLLEEHDNLEDKIYDQYSRYLESSTFDPDSKILERIRKVLMPKVTMIQGGPGCGKTRYIKEKYRGQGTLVIVPVNDLREDFDGFEVVSPHFNYDAYNPTKIVIDEVYQFHLGYIMFIHSLYPQAEIILAGDVNQIGMIDFQGILPDNYLRIEDYYRQADIVLDVSYRLGPNMVNELNNRFGVKLKSGKRNDTNIRVIDKKQLKQIKNTKVLVFTQKAKAKFEQSSTVHESQGKTFSNVTLIVTQDATALLRTPNHFYVALTRASDSLDIYYEAENIPRQYDFSEAYLIAREQVNLLPYPVLEINEGKEMIVEGSEKRIDFRVSGATAIDSILNKVVKGTESNGTNIYLNANEAHIQMKIFDEDECDGPEKIMKMKGDSFSFNTRMSNTKMSLTTAIDRYAKKCTSLTPTMAKRYNRGIINKFKRFFLKDEIRQIDDELLNLEGYKVFDRQKMRGTHMQVKDIEQHREYLVNYFLKEQSKVKPGHTDVEALDTSYMKGKAGQGVSAWSKTLNTMVAPYIRAAMTCLKESLNDVVVWANGLNEKDIGAKLQRLDWSTFSFFEGDIKEFDCNQWLGTIEMFIALLEMFGVPAHITQCIRAMRMDARLIMKGIFAMSGVRGKQHSGSPATLDENTIITMLLFAAVMHELHGVLLVKGDDSAFIGEYLFDEYYAEVASKTMNLEIVKEEDNAPQFVSNFLTPVGILPDLIRIAMKVKSAPDYTNKFYEETSRIRISYLENNSQHVFDAATMSEFTSIETEAIMYMVEAMEKYAEKTSVGTIHIMNGEILIGKMWRFFKTAIQYSKVRKVILHLKHQGILSRMEQKRLAVEDVMKRIDTPEKYTYAVKFAAKYYNLEEVDVEICYAWLNNITKMCSQELSKYHEVVEIPKRLINKEPVVLETVERKALRFGIKNMGGNGDCLYRCIEHVYDPRVIDDMKMCLGETWIDFWDLYMYCQNKDLPISILVMMYNENLIEEHMLVRNVPIKPFLYLVQMTEELGHYVLIDYTKIDKVIPYNDPELKYNDKIPIEIYEAFDNVPTHKFQKTQYEATKKPGQQKSTEIGTQEFKVHSEQQTKTQTIYQHADDAGGADEDFYGSDRESDLDWDDYDLRANEIKVRNATVWSSCPELQQVQNPKSDVLVHPGVECNESCIPSSIMAEVGRGTNTPDFGLNNNSTMHSGKRPDILLRREENTIKTVRTTTSENELFNRQRGRWGDSRECVRKSAGDLRRPTLEGRKHTIIRPDSSACDRSVQRRRSTGCNNYQRTNFPRPFGERCMDTSNNRKTNTRSLGELDRARYDAEWNGGNGRLVPTTFKSCERNSNESGFIDRNALHVQRHGSNNLAVRSSANLPNICVGQCNVSMDSRNKVSRSSGRKDRQSRDNGDGNRHFVEQRSDEIKILSHTYTRTEPVAGNNCVEQRFGSANHQRNRPTKEYCGTQRKRGNSENIGNEPVARVGRHSPKQHRQPGTSEGCRIKTTDLLPPRNGGETRNIRTRTGSNRGNRGSTGEEVSRMRYGFGSNQNITIINGKIDCRRIRGKLVHCIGRDARLGAGFAKTLNNQYKIKNKIINDININNLGVGDYSITKIDNNLTIFNLITKPYSSKPPYNSNGLNRAIKNLPKGKYIMPLIGTGLDQIDHVTVLNVMLSNPDKEFVIYIPSNDLYNLCDEYLEC